MSCNHKNIPIINNNNPTLKMESKTKQFKFCIIFTPPNAKYKIPIETTIGQILGSTKWNGWEKRDNEKRFFKKEKSS